MSVDNGPSAETPKVGEALVAALGFEPTDDSGEPEYADADEGADPNSLFGAPAGDGFEGRPPTGQLFGAPPETEPTVSVPPIGVPPTDPQPTVQVDAAGPLFDVDAEPVIEPSISEGPSLFADADSEGYRVDTVASGTPTLADSPIDVGNDKFDGLENGTTPAPSATPGSGLGPGLGVDEPPVVVPDSTAPAVGIPAVPLDVGPDPIVAPAAEAGFSPDATVAAPTADRDSTHDLGLPQADASPGPLGVAPSAGRPLFDSSDIGPAAEVAEADADGIGRGARVRGFDVGTGTPAIPGTPTPAPVGDNGIITGEPPIPTAPPVAEAQPVAEAFDAGGAAARVTGGAVAGGGLAARRALQEQSITDRVGGAASKLLSEGFGPRTRRMRARKVRRVVRHVDPWSVLTFSVLFHLCLFAALLLASVLVWNAAVAAGTIENMENLIRDLGDYQTYEINGDVVFRAAMIIAGILTLTSSLLAVLLTVVFNLISDLVGGIRVTVVEEEVVRVRRRGNR